MADGVLQRETAQLLRSEQFAESVDGIIFAARDSMGGSAGIDWLRKHCRVPVLGLSGVMSASPLQVKEVTAVTGLEVFDRDALGTASTALNLLRGDHE
ncbi:MAG: hypothetical protein GKR90_26740 [Pseudomonadales bacterium]|nr:hypothetical protein [Pseudomonadales bacterium]